MYIWLVASMQRCRRGIYPMRGAGHTLAQALCNELVCAHKVLRYIRCGGVIDKVRLAHNGFWQLILQC